MKRILVVDDDVLMTETIARMLSDYDVITAHSGQEALALVEPDAGLDLLITDYLMPSMLGDEIIGRLREHHPQLKVLVVTGCGATLDRERLSWWAAQPHLAKPFWLSDLRNTVTGLIGPPARAAAATQAR